MEYRVFYTPVRLISFVFLLSVILTAVMIPIDTPKRLPVLGEPADRNLVAPEDLTFVSNILTVEAQQEAADAVEISRTFDPGVRTAQVAALANLLDDITNIRNDLFLNRGERTSAVEALFSSSISNGPSQALISFSDRQWQVVQDRAVVTLTDVMTDNIEFSELEEIRGDIRNQVGAGLTRQQIEALTVLLVPLIEPNITINEEATAAARQEAMDFVEPVHSAILTGELIIRDGQQVDEAIIEILNHLPVAQSGISITDLLAMSILVLAGVTALGVYFVIATPDAAASNRRLILVGILIVAAAAAVRWYYPLVSPHESDKFLELVLPLAAVAVLVAALLERSLAIIVAVIVAVFAGMAGMIAPSLDSGESPTAVQALRPLVVVLFSGVAGVFASQRVERITQFGIAGAVVGLTTFVIGIAFWLLDANRGTADIGWLALVSFIVAISTSILTIGAMTTLGTLFGITTRLQLLELAQLTQPLLRRLQEEAPGTFHHSLLVATMGERAATKIEADALLVRVGAYYHDIGKLTQPHMYIENQSDGVNPHETLDPKTSATLIQEHVVQGVELARHHRLPIQVREFIPEHHGTRLVTYFFRKASRSNPNLEPGPFTYAGPRPQSRETAIIMMADSCEAVVRSSQRRDVETIDRLVDAVINERLSEHQFDDCDLTLRQLHTIGDSFKVTLRGVYHPRIEYPEPTAGERRRTRGGIHQGLSAAPEPTGPAPVDGTDFPALSEGTEDVKDNE